MALLADYEGLGVAITQGLWMLLTILASVLAAGGIVAGALKRPRRTLARWLGGSAFLIELGGVLIVCLAFADEQSRLGDYAERFRPGWFFWLVAAFTLAAAISAIYLGFASSRTHEP